MSTPIGIFIGTLPPPVSGQSVCFELLVKSLDRGVIEPVVIDISDSIIVRSGLYQNLRRFLSYFISFSCFLRVLVRRPEFMYLLISQSRLGSLRDLLFIFLANLFGVRIHLHLKGGNYDVFYKSCSFLHQKLLFLSLQKAESVIILSDRLRHIFDWACLEPGTISVVKNGSEDIAGSIERRFPSDGINLLFLSNLIVEKGYVSSIQAAVDLSSAGFPVALYLAGNFVQGAECSVYKEGAVLSWRTLDEFLYVVSCLDNVFFLGEVYGSEKDSLLRSSHVMLLPTRYINEGQPVCLIEGLSYALPLIATDFRANCDMVSVSNGVVVEYDNVGAICDAVRFVCDDTRFRRLSEASRDLFESDFTSDMHIRNLFKVLYSKAASGDSSDDVSQGM